MNKFLVVGLSILIGISLWSSSYTYDMKECEIKRGHTISEQTHTLNLQIAEVESAIAQIEDDISRTETLIQEEQEKQKGIQNKIESLNRRESRLQEQITPYKEIDKKDPRVLITLDDPVVRAQVKEITRRWRTAVENQERIFEYVRDEIEYVTEGNPKKWSYPQSFLEFKFDFWQLPRETIEWRKGDCEDQAILLCTMMRIAGVPASEVRVVVGVIHVGETIEGGHAWCELKSGNKWYALEATCSDCDFIERALYYDYYSPDVFGWFNDEEYHEEAREKTKAVLTFALV